jgi:alkyldihydroxyacetonephosphate synthase
MQAELRPAVARLYDEPEAATRLADYPDYKDHPCLCMLTFMGKKELVEVEEKLALAICEEAGGKICSNEPVFDWLRRRFVALSTQPIFEGRMMDAIEMAGPWRSLPPIYEGSRQAVLEVNPKAHIGAHWSHVYTDGGCMYMTFKIPAGDEEKAAEQYRAIWDGVMQVCLKEGGTISHHHGVGYFRSPWLKQELGVGHGLLNSIKRAVDPNNIMNPGKLGLG